MEWHNANDSTGDRRLQRLLLRQCEKIFLDYPILGKCNKNNLLGFSFAPLSLNISELKETKHDFLKKKCGFIKDFYHVSSAEI